MYSSGLRRDKDEVFGRLIRLVLTLTVFFLIYAVFFNSSIEHFNPCAAWNVTNIVIRYTTTLFTSNLCKE